MAEKTIRCKLITPEDRVFDAPVTYAQVPLWDGNAGFMHDTGAVVGKLGYGELRLNLPDGGNKSWFIASGFMQNVGNELTILAAGATAREEMNLDEARAELAEAVARKPQDLIERKRVDEDAARARGKITMLSSKR